MNTRPEYDFQTIGRNLARLRKARNLSVEDVRAYMMLGSVQAVYKWERGDSLPQADTLLALMQLYNVNNIEILLTKKESESSPFHFHLSFSSLSSFFLRKNSIMNTTTMTTAMMIRNPILLSSPVFTLLSL